MIRLSIYHYNTNGYTRVEAIESLKDHEYTMSSPGKFDAHLIFNNRYYIYKSRGLTQKYIHKYINKAESILPEGADPLIQNLPDSAHL